MTVLSNESNEHFLLSRAAHILAAFLLLTYPTVTLAVHGGASALLIAATLFSLVALVVPGVLPRMSQTADADRIAIAMCFALAGPLLATLLSGLWHGKFVWNLLDSPSRFVAAVPIFFAVRRIPARTMQWCDLSFAIGAIASPVVLLLTPHTGADRLASTFLDAIHFGDIAIVLAALSVFSLNWWRKDHTAIRIIKLAGLLAGLYASLLTGSRGGWLAVPFIAMIAVFVRGREKSHAWRILVMLAVVIAVVGIGMSSAFVRERVVGVWSDLVQYAHGHKDTATGIRLQLYEAGFYLMQHNLVFGLGPDGFANAMQALADAGRLTPTAADYGRGETHNQFLAYATNYGIIGGLAGIALHLVPCMLFARRLKAAAAPMRRAALLGLTFVVSFWIFGLSVETFDLKMVASFYAAIVAILGGIASSAAAPAPQRANPPSISYAQSP